MSCISARDPQLARLAHAIAQRVGPQRFHVWFSNSTKLDLRQDGLEIAVPNDFISEWIGSHFARPIQEAAHEVLGCSLPVRFSVVPQLFEAGGAQAGEPALDPPVTAGASVQEMRSPPRAAVAAVAAAMTSAALLKVQDVPAVRVSVDSSACDALEQRLARAVPVMPPRRAAQPAVPPRLRHDLETFVVGVSNQLAYNAAVYVSEFPGAQYNPLFLHGDCGLGKTHLLQGLCRRFAEHHPAKRWLYLTGEEFTNEFLSAMRSNRLEGFRRRLRDVDLLAIDDVHFLSGKRATQEEFLHTFNAIEALGRQVVMASDNHPKMIEEFGESLINRFVSGMVVRIDPPNYATRCQILQAVSDRRGMSLPDEVITWIARRVTQNVRELEGAVTRIAAHVRLAGREPDMALVQEALGDLDRQHIAPVRPEAVCQAVCNYFGLENKDLMSGRRQRTISLARSIAMYLVRKTARLSFPEIGLRMGKRNHSTVISACRRIEQAVLKNEPLAWNSSIGERQDEAAELVQRLEEQARVGA